MGSCEHKQFDARVNVNRLEDSGRFHADVQIRCAQCREPFRFIGASAGLHFEYPTCSIDGLELRAPIEPQGAVQVYRQPGLCTRYVAGEGRHRLQASCPLAPAVPCAPESE